MKNGIGLGLPAYNTDSTNTALIIGAGLAGCAVANALALRGYTCKLYDKNPEIASATSALPVAVVRPIISQDKLHSDFINKAFNVCCETLDANLFNQCGILELTNSNKPVAEPAAASVNAEWLSAKSASTLAGVEISTDAYFIKQAGWVSPARLCEFWANNANIEFHGKQPVAQLRQTEFGWQLLAEDNNVIDESRLVIIANANSARQFELCRHLPLQSISGQIDLFENNHQALNTIISGNGYVIPQQQSFWCGATHHRDSQPAQVSAEDTRANNNTAQRLMPDSPTHHSPPTLSIRSFAATRAATPDRRPVVGALPIADQYRIDFADCRHGKPAAHFPAPSYHQGVYIAAGFGSRGATVAAYTGQLLSELIAGQQDNEAALQALHPARFLLRDLRRRLPSHPVNNTLQ